MVCASTAIVRPVGAGLAWDVIRVSPERARAKLAKGRPRLPRAASLEPETWTGGGPEAHAAPRPRALGAPALVRALPSSCESCCRDCSGPHGARQASPARRLTPLRLLPVRT